MLRLLSTSDAALIIYCCYEAKKDWKLAFIRREKQDGSGLRSNLNRRSNFEDFWVGHPEKSLLKMSDSLVMWLINPGDVSSHHAILCLRLPFQPHKYLGLG
jgi:hypothetical protein